MLMTSVVFNVLLIALPPAALGRFTSQAQPDSGEDCKPICYDNIDCMGQCAPWVSLTRPVPPPQPPQEVCTSVVASNRQIRNKVIEIYPTVSAEVDAMFNASLPTFIISHGFLSFGLDSRFTNMSDALLGRMDANVFIIDWGKGAQTLRNPNYLAAVANARTAAAVAVNLVKRLKSLGGNLDRFHFIGHSLGAHICAYICKKFPGECGVLTGLDAASPLFQDRPEQIRFSKRDARSTDAIHTNVLIFGLLMKIADADFYANTGINQPLCKNPPNPASSPNVTAYINEFVTYIIACPHLASIQYYTAAIKSPGLCIGRQLTLTGATLSLINGATRGVFLDQIKPLVPSCDRIVCIPLGLEAEGHAYDGYLHMATAENDPFCYM